MNITRTIIFLIIVTVTVSRSFGQYNDSTTLIINIGSPEFYPKKLDSVIFSDINEKQIATLANVTTQEGRITVALPYGFYFIKLKSKGFKFPDSNCATVCSKCDNKVRLICYDERRPGFEAVIMSPSYYKINHDFKQSLTIEEYESLKKLDDLEINFFVTRYMNISDISINSKNIALTDKEAIIKGIKSLKTWRPAEANGKTPADGFVSIKLSRLLKE